MSLSALLDNDGPSPKRASDRVWLQLEFLAVVESSLVELDASLALLPVVKTVWLAQNQLRSIAPLKACANLQELDVSFNRIDSVAGANWILPQIVSLDLSHNALSSTAGLERLFTLEVLNLSHNAISSIAEVGYLVALPNLYSLFLQGNPVASRAAYRTDVQKLLTNEVMLDGVPYASQDVEEFAKEATGGGRHQQRESIQLKQTDRHHLDTRNTNGSSSGAGPDTEYEGEGRSSWVVVTARSVLLAIVAIVLVQAGVHLTASDSVDLERGQLLLRWLATLGAGAALVLAGQSMLLRISGQASSPIAATPRGAAGGAAMRHNAGRVDEGSMRRFSRTVSSCLVDEMYLQLHSAAADDGSIHRSVRDDKVALDVFRTSLASLAESPEVRRSHSHNAMSASDH